MIQRDVRLPPFYSKTTTTLYHDFDPSIGQDDLRSLQNNGLGTKSISVPVEQDTRSLTGRTLVGLNPVASAERLIHALDETNWSIRGIRSIMLAHNLLDGLGGFIGVVEGDGADIVVKNVGLDDTVEELSADESEFSVDGCGGSTGVCPALTGVVGKRWVSVLKVGDCDEPVVDPEVWEPVPDEHV